MDLALNNLQKLICHKTQTTNQHKNGITIILMLHNFFSSLAWSKLSLLLLFHFLHIIIIIWLKAFFMLDVVPCFI